MGDSCGLAHSSDLCPPGAQLCPLAEQLPDIVARFDRRFRHVYVNRWVEAHTGIAAAEFLGKSSRDLNMPEPLVELWETALQRVFETGEASTLEFEFATPGGPAHFEARLVPERGRNGRVRSILCISRDVTECRTAEETLRQTGQMLQALIQASPIAIAAIDLEQRVTMWNPAAERIFGWKKAEVLGRPLPTVPTEGEAEFRARLNQGWNGKPTISWEARRLTKHGGTVDVCVWTAPLYDPSGAVTGIMGMLADVTEQKRIEAALRRSEELTRRVLEAVPASVILLDSSGQIVAANQASAHMFGMPCEEIVKLHLMDFATRTIWEDGTDCRIEDLPVSRCLRTGQAERSSIVGVRRADGGILWAYCSVSPLLDPDSGAQTGAVVISLDMTERKQAEAERIRYAAQLQQLAAASSIIHSGSSVSQIVRVVTEKAQEIVGANVCGTVLLSSGRQRAVRHVALSAAERYADWRGRGLLPEKLALAQLVCSRNIPIRLDQAALDAHPDGNLAVDRERFPPLRGWLAAPLLDRNGKNVGLIQLSDKVDGDFTADDEAILVQLAQMASVAIENTRLLDQVRSGRQDLQALSQRLLEVQESERRHLARELHDEIGQLLTGLRFAVDAAARKHGQAAENLEPARDLITALIGRVRALSGDLRPGMLDDLGLLPTLLWHCDRYRAQTGVRVRLHHHGLEDRRLDAAVETAAYRIIQEALTNVARHAQVSEAAVRVRLNGAWLRLEVEDRGAGFELFAGDCALSSGGLSGMRERALLLGGRFEIDSRPGAGTLLRAELPITALTKP